MKEKLIQLLSDASENYGEAYEKRCIYDNDFESLAEDIVKLFAIPDVSFSEERCEVCPTCDDKGWIMCDDGKNLCPDCGCYLG